MAGGFHWQRWVVAATLAFGACAGASAVAQSASRPDLKAAFLYNFAKLTEWPEDALPAGATLVLCVVESTRVTRALEEAVASREIDGHPLAVRKMEAHGPIRSCHLLYVDDLDAKRARQLLDALSGAAVLTVSDFTRFTEMGGTAHLFEEAGRMRFAVNVDAAQRHRLRLSSRLLSLAKLVKDNPYASRP